MMPVLYRTRSPCGKASFPKTHRAKRVNLPKANPHTKHGASYMHVSALQLYSLTEITRFLVRHRRNMPLDLGHLRQLDRTPQGP